LSIFFCFIFCSSVSVSSIRFVAAAALLRPLPLFCLFGFVAFVCFVVFALVVASSYDCVCVCVSWSPPPSPAPTGTHTLTSLLPNCCCRCFFFSFLHILSVLSSRLHFVYLISCALSPLLRCFCLCYIAFQSLGIAAPQKQQQQPQRQQTIAVVVVVAGVVVVVVAPTSSSSFSLFSSIALPFHFQFAYFANSTFSYSPIIDVKGRSCAPRSLLSSPPSSSSSPPSPPVPYRNSIHIHNRIHIHNPIHIHNRIHILSPCPRRIHS